MAKTGQDITIYTGDDVTIEASLLDAVGSALDLTGASLQWGMASLRRGISITKSSATSAEIAVTNAAQGKASIYLSSSDTATLEADTYQHELRFVGTDGKAETVLTGSVIVRNTIL